MIVERINGKIEKDNQFNYNPKNKLISQTYSLGRLEYDYYPDGHVHHQLQIDHEIGREFLHTYSYEDGYLQLDHLYYYCANWHLIDNYARDRSGNIIKHKSGISWEDLKKTKWDEFEYEFDDMGNWFKCIHYRNKTPIYIIERSIEYY